MKTAEKIIKNMIEECPFIIRPSLEPYILEAMKLYANAKLDEAADRADIIDDCVERRVILLLKDKV